jgi:hypothetical protein
VDWTHGRQELSLYAVTILEYLVFAACWTLYWNVAADRRLKEFLGRTHLLRYFWLYGVGMGTALCTLLVLGLRFQRSEVWSLYGPLSLFSFRLGTAALLQKPLILFLVGYRKGASRLVRQQLWTLFAGSVIGLVGYDVVVAWPYENLYAPFINGAWGNIILLLYPLSIAYTVLRYQLFDIRVVIRKGLVYSILTAGLTAVFLVLSMAIGSAFQSWTGQQTFLAAVLPALIVAVMFRPAQTRVQTFVDRTFFRHEYEVRQTLTGFSRGLSTLRDQDEVTRLVLDTVTQTLGAEQATFWLLDAEHKAYRAAAQTGQASQPVPELPAESEVPFTLFTERHALMLPPSDTSPQAVELHNLGAVLAVPLIAEQRLLGFLTLGTKRSGLLYTDDDLDLLGTLAQSATLALENARLHEERLAILRQQLAQGHRRPGGGAPAHRSRAARWGRSRPGFAQPPPAHRSQVRPASAFLSGRCQDQFSTPILIPRARARRPSAPGRA